MLATSSDAHKQGNWKQKVTKMQTLKRQPSQHYYFESTQWNRGNSAMVAFDAIEPVEAQSS